MKSLKKLLIVLIILAVIGLIAVWLFGDDDEETESGSGDVQSGEIMQHDSAAHSITHAAPGSRGIVMSVDNSGALTISRLGQSASSPMGEADSWTIFVYLCGADLESDGGMASMDLDEMIDGSSGKRFRYIVQTGGSSDWENSHVNARSRQRFLVEDGKMTLVDEGRNENMGRYETLQDFLSWGVANYPAEHMGVIFWDHGGGSISGVCYDENADDDCLSLREIDAAFAPVWQGMTDSFEFIGFDACLMATIETANICATYADYFYASEETEPGYGWDYESIGKYLQTNPDADGGALGKAVADSYYESCAEDDSEDQSTFSVLDLGRMDALLAAFNRYAQNLYAATEDREALTATARRINDVTSFGGNNWFSGYTNMVDFGGLVDAGDVDGEREVLSALKSAVSYMRNGSDYPDVTGLSMYYPISIEEDELAVFSEIAVSPYYLSFVDRTVQTGVNGEGDYDFSILFDLWNLLFEDTDSEEEQTQHEQENEAYWAYADDYEVTGESGHITFAEKPGLDEDGTYSFRLTREALLNTLAVEGSVFLEEDGDFIDLGTTAMILADWESGTFADDFDGWWFSLPDGQVLAVYVENEGNGFDTYSSPIKLDGKETNLIFRHDWRSGDVTILGVRDCLDDAGMSDRLTNQLRRGDKITPLYDATSEDGEEFIYEGEAWSYDGKGELTFSLLPDGDYLYGFTIYDIYWDYLDTEPVRFTVDGEDVYYTEMR